MLIGRRPTTDASRVRKHRRASKAASSFIWLLCLRRLTVGHRCRHRTPPPPLNAHHLRHPPPPLNATARLQSRSPSSRRHHCRCPMPRPSPDMIWSRQFLLQRRQRSAACSSLPTSGRPQKSCPKGAGRIIRVPDLQGQTGVLLKDAFRHKLMEREVLPSSIFNFGRCGAIFTTGIAELLILASQPHARVLPLCDREARTVCVT